MPNTLRASVVACALFVLCQTGNADSVYNVAINTTQLIGHPAGPFYLYLAFTDGSGLDDAANVVTISNVDFGGGSGLGGPTLFGGATGSLETSVSMTNSSFISVFSEQFAPGLDLSFTLGLTSNDEPGGTPDRFTLFLLDSSGVALPTLSPAADYFLGVDLGSAGPIFDVYGSDPSRAPSEGDPISIPAPTISAVVPEPATCSLLGSVFLAIIFWKRLRRHT